MADSMDIAEWRRQIDEIDRKLVELLNQRARMAQQIGRLKRHTRMPIREPERERTILENVRRASRGPLPPEELAGIFERMIAAMRKLQKDEMLAEQPAEHCARRRE
ncbi:MAG TPA: chorismate mutase [Terriglobales bacterium]|nr:chorismate mutase [Terriglobales bacterium]